MMKKHENANETMKTTQVYSKMKEEEKWRVGLQRPNDIKAQKDVKCNITKS